jgi:hypothetical protein
MSTVTIQVTREATISDRSAITSQEKAAPRDDCQPAVTRRTPQAARRNFRPHRRGRDGELEVGGGTLKSTAAGALLRRTDVAYRKLVGHID